MKKLFFILLLSCFIIFIFIFNKSFSLSNVLNINFLDEVDYIYITSEKYTPANSIEDINIEDPSQIKIITDFLSSLKLKNTLKNKVSYTSGNKIRLTLYDRYKAVSENNYLTISIIDNCFLTVEFPDTLPKLYEITNPTNIDNIQGLLN